MREDVHDLYGVPDEKIRVIHNGIDLDQYRPTPDPAVLDRLRDRPGAAVRPLRRPDHPAEGDHPPGRRDQAPPARACRSSSARGPRTRGDRPGDGRARSSRPAGESANPIVWIAEMRPQGRDHRALHAGRRSSSARRSTSRSGSSTWRRWPAGRRWWPRPSAGSRRWSSREDRPARPVRAGRADRLRAEGPARFARDLAAAINRLLDDPALLRGDGPGVPRARRALLQLAEHRPLDPRLLRRAPPRGRRRRDFRPMTQDGPHEAAARPALPTPARRLGLQEQDPLAARHDAPLPRGPDARRASTSTIKDDLYEDVPLRRPLRPGRPDLHVAPGVAGLPDRRRVPAPRACRWSSAASTPRSPPRRRCSTPTPWSSARPRGSGPACSRTPATGRLQGRYRAEKLSRPEGPARPALRPARPAPLPHPQPAGADDPRLPLRVQLLRGHAGLRRQVPLPAPRGGRRGGPDADAAGQAQVRLLRRRHLQRPPQARLRRDGGPARR